MLALPCLDCARLQGSAAGMKQSSRLQSQLQLSKKHLQSRLSSLADGPLSGDASNHMVQLPPRPSQPQLNPRRSLPAPLWQDHDEYQRSMTQPQQHGRRRSMPMLQQEMQARAHVEQVQQQQQQQQQLQPGGEQLEAQEEPAQGEQLSFVPCTSLHGYLACESHRPPHADSHRTNGTFAYIIQDREARAKQDKSSRGRQQEGCSGPGPQMADSNSISSSYGRGARAPHEGSSGRNRLSEAIQAHWHRHKDTAPELEQGGYLAGSAPKHRATELHELDTIVSQSFTARCGMARGGVGKQDAAPPARDVAFGSVLGYCSAACSQRNSDARVSPLGFAEAGLWGQQNETADPVIYHELQLKPVLDPVTDRWVEGLSLTQPLTSLLMGQA